MIDSDRPAVRVAGLTKSFGAVQALRGVDLVIPRASVVGLLGPNGAGKTTVVRILATLLRPDSGSAEVDGFDVVRCPNAVRARIGLTGQFAAVDPALTGRENVRLVGRLCHLSRPEAARRTQELLERFDLLDAADRPAKTYSGGMARRLDLAASLVGRPSVLFLDEPTAGLDPRGRLSVWEAIRTLVAEGTTLLLTTQYLEEADQLANGIFVLDSGRVIAAGTSAELKRTGGGDVVEVTFAEPAAAARAADVLDSGGSGPVQRDPVHPRLRLPAGARGPMAVLDVVRDLDAVGLRPTDVAVRRPSLDEVFLALTGCPVDQLVAADGAARAAAGFRSKVPAHPGGERG